MKHKRMASVCLALWLLLLLLPGCSIGGLGIDGVGGTPQSTPPRSRSSQADKTPGGEDKKTGGEDRTPDQPPSHEAGTASGGAGEQDQYLTDPVPEGKPRPSEPQDQVIDGQKTCTCTFSIECSTILSNMESLNPDKVELVPPDGVILPPTVVTFHEGESVFDVLQRVCRDNGIHMESSWTPIYNSAYIEGIHNLYEFDCGDLSGWMYCVNDWYPNYGCSRYQLESGDIVQWRYTCDLGNDVGGGYATGE